VAASQGNPESSGQQGADSCLCEPLFEAAVIYERSQRRLPRQGFMNRAHASFRSRIHLLTGLCALLWSSRAGAAVYHVAQSQGSDSNDGSEAKPFATISACAKVAQAGDTCTVHAGTYRETVAPANSGTATDPITFSVADGECATVSGTESLSSGFTPTQNSVWVLPVTDNIEQMFSNGAMIWEAQWPNRNPGVLFQSPKGIAGPGTGVVSVDGGSVTHLVDPSIPPGDWTGASVFIMPGARWQSDSRPVAAYDAATHTLTLDTTVPWAEKSIQPIPFNQYYLYGTTLALDTQDEWVLVNGNLYYYSSDDPSNHGLEYKKRYYAFDVSQSYVKLVGFHVFGSAVRVAGNHDTVDSFTIEYSSHLRSFNAYYTMGDVNRITGDDNVWQNTLIDKSGSAGLVVAGNRNLIENNIAQDVVYQATNHAGFDLPDCTVQCLGNLLFYNTVNRSGRSGIFLYGSENGRALFNKVTDWALLTNDMGGIYAWGTDGQGTEIAFNDLGGSTAFWSNGIYLDDKSKHFVVHHNYVHDSRYFGFCIKQENDFFNNTVANVGTPFLIDKDFQIGAWTNTNLAKVENNLADETLLVRVGVLPTIVTDYGYYEAPVHVTPDWQHLVIPFSSLYQPAWFVPQPLDLTSIQQVAFTPWTNGDFEFDLDNLELVGPAPLVVDDFESGGGQNGLGGYPWGGGSGDGVASTIGTLSYQDGGATTASTKHAHFAGTVVLGDNSWGVMTESVPNRNLSAYTGIAFDIRGRRIGLRVLATGNNSPIQDHNGSCAFTGTSVPDCALDRGTTIAGITDGFAGVAPDLGAFEATATPWAAGAQRSADPAACGKIADVTDAPPPQYVPSWADGGAQDGAAGAAAFDGGAGGESPDGAVDGGLDASAPDAADASEGVHTVAGGSGCDCRTGGPARRGSVLVALIALSALALRRRRATGNL
jgi:MYXO-CTERM domain-containing protein